MQSHTNRMAIFALKTEDYLVIVSESWRWTWDTQKEDGKVDIHRPTEDEAIATVYLKEQGEIPND